LLKFLKFLYSERVAKGGALFSLLPLASMSKGFVPLQKMGMEYLLQSKDIYRGTKEKFKEYKLQVCNVI